MTLPSIADRMTRHPRTQGFDHLRLLLAIGVVVFHSFMLSDGDARHVPAWFQRVAALLLPGFFVISGFLVAGSLARSPSLRRFLLLRLLRIGPALLLVVALTALVMGPILSTHGLASYFASPAWIAYFGNTVGLTQFGLPGVFETNPRGPVVNGSLWTIPLEAACYILLAGTALAGALRQAVPFFAVVAVLAIGGAMLRPDIPGVLTPDLVLFFFAGAAFYGVRAHVPLHGLLCAVCLLLSFWLIVPGQALYAAVLPLAYAVIWLGLRVLPILPGDYSYGLYLSAYPLQQIYSHYVPDYRVWWANTAFALLLGLIFAALSWHLLESRVLALRSRLGRHAAVHPPSMLMIAPVMDRAISPER